MPKIYDLGTITVSAAPQTGRLTSFTPSATQNQESRLSHEEAKVKTLVELERLIQEQSLEIGFSSPTDWHNGWFAVLYNIGQW